MVFKPFKLSIIYRDMVIVMFGLPVCIATRLLVNQDGDVSGEEN
jgi:hypothetical protein